MGERKDRWLKEQRDREFKKNRRAFSKMKKNRPSHTSWADLMNQRRGKNRYGKKRR